ncbi:MAG: FAD:protein FMN transferase [Candidatus Omnitrophica bacterium]|nr:FAD:protein FMN transferase [Candidatus Omnitrophota bacterium]
MTKIICVVIILFTAGCSRVPGYSEYSNMFIFMGTFGSVKVISREFSVETLRKKVDVATKRANILEEKLSIFIEHSELNELNVSKKMKVTDDLFQLIARSIEVSRLTGGKFDITIAPILKKEGFYHDMPKSIRDKIPENFDGVGWENVILKEDTKEIELLSGAWIDLSGIAKGYIVDEMAEFFVSKGIVDFLINAGGDIYAGGTNRAKAWKIGLRRPDSGSLDEMNLSEYVILTLNVENMAVATSGDYENVIIASGEKTEISHIIDPRDARSKRMISSSITVIAPTCTYADALATGMMVSGGKEALKLANTLLGIEVIAVTNVNNHPEINFSKNARGYIKT